MELEKRFFNTEIRTEKEEKNTTVTGHGAVFNQRATIGWFDEIVEEGAFDEALKISDVRALKNHNADWVLGRTKSGTLTLGTDETGLTYRYISPNTTYANDLIISMERGDVDQSSYAFTLKRKDEDGMNGDEWNEDKDGKITRTIKANGVKRLYDVSVVTYPAFEGASAQIEKSSEIARRSFEDQKETGNQKEEAKKAIEERGTEIQNANYLKLLEVDKHKYKQH